MTRGLVDGLDDAELAAAVAHEIGHLLDEGHLRSRAGLRGGHTRSTGSDAEARADAVGVTLLESAGLPRSAMVGMLEKVADAPGLSTSTRSSIRRRIGLLGRQLSTRPTSPAPSAP